jgi:hypothetical protein
VDPQRADLPAERSHGRDQDVAGAPAGPIEDAAPRWSVGGEQSLDPVDLDLPR